MKPKRIHRERTKGWRMPDGAVYVGRPTPWGNPFPVKGDWITWMAVTLGYRGDANGRRAASVSLYESWLTREPTRPGPEVDNETAEAIEYSDGTVTTMDQVARGFAAIGAVLSEDKPTVGTPPDLEPLRGRDLACWCSGGQPCHADVLLRLANA